MKFPYLVFEFFKRGVAVGWILILLFLFFLLLPLLLLRMWLIEAWVVVLFWIEQESIKCMRHSMRTFLSTEDVDTALALRNLEVTCFCFYVFTLAFRIYYSVLKLLWICWRFIEVACVFPTLSTFFPQTSVCKGFVSVSIKRYLFVVKRMANWHWCGSCA